MEDEPLVVLCTAPSEDVGAALARGLVEAKLAACVNLVPGVRSLYLWQGAVHDEREVQLVIKTRRARFDALERWLSDHHPYDVPEVLALSVAGGSADYLRWIEESTGEDA
jgi:periplasmic divalent cation tolerance protein